MKIHLTRSIFFHSEKTGLISRTVYKEYDWEIIPVAGHSVDDPTWHRHDIPVIEEVRINAEQGDMYIVRLQPLDIGIGNNINVVDKSIIESDIDRRVANLSHHGWKPA